MRTYRFEVKGLPPKKDGAQSMWGKPLEAKRLVALRQAALKAIQDSPPLQSNIRLTLKIHVGSIKPEQQLRWTPPLRQDRDNIKVGFRYL